MSNEGKAMMRGWPSGYGCPKRQQSVWQEATIARTGTLPEAFYHEELRTSVTKGCNGAIDSEQEIMELHTDNTDMC